MKNRTIVPRRERRLSRPKHSVWTGRFGLSRPPTSFAASARLATLRGPPDSPPPPTPPAPPLPPPPAVPPLRPRRPRHSARAHPRHPRHPCQPLRLFRRRQRSGSRGSVLVVVVVEPWCSSWSRPYRSWRSSSRRWFHRRLVRGGGSRPSWFTGRGSPDVAAPVDPCASARDRICIVRAAGGPLGRTGQQKRTRLNEATHGETPF